MPRDRRKRKPRKLLIDRMNVYSVLLAKGQPQAKPTSRLFCQLGKDAESQA